MPGPLGDLGGRTPRSRSTDRSVLIGLIGLIGLMGTAELRKAPG